jgi:transcription antitermination factor NusA-like protein
VFLNKLAGHLDKDSVVDSVPRCLVERVLIIEHGPDIKSQIENGLAKSASFVKWF